MATFHEILRNLKEQSGKTQIQIAEELGMTPQNLSYYFNGREPSYETLIKLAQYFNVSTDYLLGISNNKNNEEVIKKNSVINYLDENNRLSDVLIDISECMHLKEINTNKKNFIFENFIEMIKLYIKIFERLNNIKQLDSEQNLLTIFKQNRLAFFNKDISTDYEITNELAPLLLSSITTEMYKCIESLSHVYALDAKQEFEDVDKLMKGLPIWEASKNGAKTRTE